MENRENQDQNISEMLERFDHVTGKCAKRVEENILKKNHTALLKLLRVSVNEIQNLKTLSAKSVSTEDQAKTSKILLKYYPMIEKLIKMLSTTEKKREALELYIKAIKEGLIRGHSISPNIELSGKGNSILICAILDENIEHVDLLLKKGADVEKIYNGNCTALHFSALSGTNDSLTKVLEHLDKRYNDDLGALLHSNTQINYPHDYTKMREGSVAYFKIINHKNDAGETALHIAVERGSINHVNLLLEYGADFTLEDTISETALHKAAQNDLICAYQALLRAAIHKLDPTRFEQFCNQEDLLGKAASHIICKEKKNINAILLTAVFDLINICKDNKEQGIKYARNFHDQVRTIISDNGIVWHEDHWRQITKILNEAKSINASHSKVDLLIDNILGEISEPFTTLGGTNTELSVDHNLRK